MTRKQAVLRAIKILEKNKKNDQVVEVLKGIYTDLPLVKWNQASIIDAFSEYIKDNKKIPTCKELGGKCKYRLPASVTICKVFNVSDVSEFEKQYFPKEYERYISTYKYSVYQWTDKDFKECFLKNYYSMLDDNSYVTMEFYDTNRDPETPSVKTIIVRLRCKTYQELLDKVGVKKVKNKFTVKSNKRTIVSINKL